MCYSIALQLTVQSYGVGVKREETGREKVVICDYLFTMLGLALFLGMLHTMADQDTLEKVNQGGKTHVMIV